MMCVGENLFVVDGGPLVRSCPRFRRPLFDYESQKGEYDVVKVRACSALSDTRGTLVAEGCGAQGRR